MRRLAGLFGVLAFVLAGCGGTTSGIGAGASDLVPASAPVFVAINTDPDSSQWKTVDALASKFPDKQKGIDAIKRDLRKDDGIDWEKDVKPAIGKELDAVWLDFENDGENFVVLMQPKDASKFKQLIAKGNKNEKDPADRIVYEKFRDWYVLGQNHAMIGRFKAASESATKTLSEQSDFKRSMDRLGGDAIVRAYVNGRAIMDLVHRYSGPELNPFIDKAGTLDWIAMRLAVNSKGVGLDAIVHGTPGKLFSGLPLADAFSAKLPDAVPQNALVYWTFHGSKNMFAGLEKNSFFKTPEFRPYRRALREIGTLLQGENALYVRPGAGRAPGVPFKIPEVTFVAAPGKGTDPAAVVDGLLIRELEVIPHRTRIAGTSVRKLGEDQLAGYYANVDGKLVLTDLPAGIRGVKNVGTPLSESEMYRDAADASGLPDKTHGFIYVDLHSTIPLVEKLAQQRVPADIRRNLKPLQSAMEYAVSRSHELQISFFLLLK
jgi:uncharacterized protein DUF3352